MADPTPYVVSYSFSGFQATNPASPLPAPQVDDEYANIAASIGTLVAGLIDVRRSDGALKNGIVTIDSLSTAVGARLGVAYDSAYDVAVAEGFVGTEEEWLESLAANVTIGTVTTSAAGSSAEVTATGTAPDVVLNFVLPRGAAGPSGAGSGDMLEATYDPTAVGGDAFNMANMAEAADAKVLTAAERTAITGIASKLGSGDVASAAEVRSNNASKIIDTTSAWGAAAFVALTDAVTVAIDLDDFVNASVIIAGNRTLGSPQNPKSGQSGCIRVTASGATRTISKHSSYKSATPFPLSILSGETAYLFYFVSNSTNVILSVVDGVV
jgi:hypothetical protein